MSTKSSVVRVTARVFNDPALTLPYLGSNTFLCSRTRTGAVLPKYKQVIADGLNATNDLVGTARSIQLDDVTARLALKWPLNAPPSEQKIIVCRASGALAALASSGFASPVYGASVSVANQKALTIAFKRLREEQMSISGPVFLGELRQTISLIRGAAKQFVPRLQRYVRDVTLISERTPRRRPLTRRQQLADAWLQFSFGAQPLLSDIDKGALALSRSNEEKTRRRKIKSTGKDSSLLNQSSPFGLSYADKIFFIGQTLRASDAFVIYRVGLQADLSWPEASVSKLAGLTGFTLSEWAPTAWELCPWSFFIDYFSNVGTVIEASVTDLSRVAWVSKSVRQVSFSQTSLRMDMPLMRASYGGNLIAASMGGNAVAKFAETDLKRDRLSELNYPSLAFGFPGKPAQWLNMAALKESTRSLTPFFSFGRR